MLCALGLVWLLAAPSKGILDLLREDLPWRANIDRGGTKFSSRFEEGRLVFEAQTDGGEEDYPKLRLLFPNPHDWRPITRIHAKVRVTSPDKFVKRKRMAFVFYDEKTRLEGYPGRPMKQQCIFYYIPVGKWVTLDDRLFQIRRSSIRQLDIYLYETPPVRPHRYCWEIAELRLERGGEKAIAFDGEVFGVEKMRGEVGRAVGSVETEDGMALVMGSRGEVHRLVYRGKVLGSASEGRPTGILVRDVARGGLPVQAGGEMRPSEGAVSQRATLKKLGLHIEATYRSKGLFIEVSGTVADLKGEDRAVSVYLALPVERGSWVWWDSVSTSRTEADYGELAYFETGMQYGLDGAHSKYPLGAISWPEVAGLTIAVRMDEPVVHRIVYNSKLGLFFIAFDFGLVPERTIEGRPLSVAPFRALIYAHDPEWGMRSALRRYYELFPQFFVKRVKVEGGWYVWGNMAETPGALEAGFAFHWGPSDAKAVKWDNEHGTLALFYIEPETCQLSLQDFEKTPTGEEAISRLQKLAQGEEAELEAVAKTSYKIYPLSPEGGDIKACIRETAQTVLKSLNLDEEEKPYCHLGKFDWMGRRWGAIFFCNLSPLLPGGKGEFNLRRVIEPSLKLMEKQGARFDGVGLDSFGGYEQFSRVNFRREHFRFSSVPLSFSAHGYEPAQVAAFTTIEWLKWLAKWAHERGLVLMANCSWGSTPGWLAFAAPYLDIFGAEAPRFEDPDFIRAIAQRKPCTDLPYKPQPEWEVAWHLLHGIFPGHGNDVEILKRYSPLLRQLSKAGWEPITGARSEPASLKMERFGDGEEFFLVAHNPSDERVEAKISLDERVLGEGPFKVLALLEGRPVPADKEGRLLIEIPPKGTVTLRLLREGKG